LEGKNLYYLFNSLRKVAGVLVLLFVVSCNYPGNKANNVNTTPVEQNPPATDTATPTAKPLRLLKICLANEPSSLFLYADQSDVANSIREAIYDMPWDITAYQPSPVILKEIPTIHNGLIKSEPVEIHKGDLIENAQGELVNLDENTVYLPSGCSDESCVQTYTGQEIVQLDQQVVRFTLLPGLTWSDGELLTAADSQYSYELALKLFPYAETNLIPFTSSYLALDETTVEWRGVPGYKDAYAGQNFFMPLPKHAWEMIPVESLATEAVSGRTPLGWGAYKIDEWIPGDSILLSSNLNYYRKSEELPRFDELIYKFLSPDEDIIALIENGDCDIIDNSLINDDEIPDLLDAEKTGSLKVNIHPGLAWEHLDFGIVSYSNDPYPPFSLFSLKETRQAMATCIDRQRMVDELTYGISEVPDVYLPSSHPLHNADIKQYRFEPQTASAIFDSIGWRDIDNDPATPRVAVGIQGIPDGTPLSTTLLISDEPEKVRIAQIIQESLVQCGVEIQIQDLHFDELLQPGPDGLIFGRQFSMAEFNWSGSVQPPCFLYTTKEIPGPYPEFPKGWGGANVTGYSNLDFDRACHLSEEIIENTPGNIAAQYQAQAFFTEDIPSIPLYIRLKIVVTRPDFCWLNFETGTVSAFSNIEMFDYGEGCQP
jgi:peptide/nickel transport system substrate-binding protein